MKRNSPKKTVPKKASSRRPIAAAERLLLWVRSGGRCVICNRYLLEGKLSGREATFGELAHIVGQGKGKKSPRGSAALAVADRDKAENLVLLCDDEHDEIDRKKVEELFSVETLSALKREHEERILHVTGLGPDRRTTILRMVGSIGGAAVELDRDTATATVIRGAGRFPVFSMAFNRRSIEIDLRGLPDESKGTPAYYATAKRVIDEVVKHKLREGIAQEEIDHLSVFAFARVPLLVYLGSRLDDGIKTDIYQRHRTPEGWSWPVEAAVRKFSITEPIADPSHAEAVVVMNISGSTQVDRIPPEVAALPRFSIDVAGETPSSDVINSTASLAAFESTCRGLFAAIEARHSELRRLHVFAAVSLSAAVALGRVHNPDVHPNLVTYHLVDSTYSRALEIGPEVDSSPHMAVAAVVGPRRSRNLKGGK